jgi:uncharacterized protein DUF4124
MLRNLAISTVLSACAVSAAHADVYRWVDDHGGVHYSDQWVAGSEVIKSSVKPPSSGGASQTSYSAPKSSNAPPSKDNAAKAVKEDVAKARDQQCKEARDKYEKAIQARRIYKAPAPGDKAATKDTDRPDDRQYLSEEEADAYRVKARQEVADYCGPSK